MKSARANWLNLDFMLQLTDKDGNCKIVRQIEVWMMMSLTYDDYGDDDVDNEDDDDDDTGDDDVAADCVCDDDGNGDVTVYDNDDDVGSRGKSQQTSCFACMYP